MKQLILILFLSATTLMVSAQQKLSLSQCIDLAKQSNMDVRQVKQSLETRKYRLEASKLRKLPDLDILGGYTYQSDPIKINLQTMREGIVQGTAKQNVDAANRVYKEITGNNLSQSAQDAIYGGAADIIDGLYPNYNPEFSQQQYFTAGIAMRMPLYLGGKLNAAQKLANERVESGEINVRFIENSVAFTVIAQYMKVLYLNAMVDKQKQLVETYENTKNYARSLVLNEIIPPYQGHWANVALTQAKVGLQKFVLEKESALLSLTEMLGKEIEDAIQIDREITLVQDPTLSISGNFWEKNPSYRWLKSKEDVAKVTEEVTKSASYPNIFGIANYQFLKQDLPLITPPWMVGIAFQWNIFSSLENKQKVKAARSFVKESEFLTEKRKKSLQRNLKVAQNKLTALRSQVKSLDQARKEAARTTGMIRKRMKNKMSSVKNVNDALKVQLEAEKAYYTTVMAYNIAAAMYLNMQGEPERIVDYLN